MEPAFIRYIILLWLHTSIDISLSASHPSPPVTPAYSVSNKINAYTLCARGNRVTVSRQWPPYVKLELDSISRTKRASPPRTLANAPRRRISSFMEAAVYVFSRILFIKLTSNFQVWVASGAPFGQMWKGHLRSVLCGLSVKHALPASGSFINGWYQNVKEIETWCQRSISITVSISVCINTLVCN